MSKKYIATRHQTPSLHSISSMPSSNNTDLINLSIGDPDLTTPEVIIDAAFEDARQGETHYTAGRGQIELREAICGDLAEQGIVATAAEECMVTTSACHALWLSLESIVNDGDEVIIFSPYFTPYLDQIKLTRGVPVDCPTSADNDFQIDPERLRATITDKTKAMIINTPNNPSGACYTRETLTEIAKIAQEHDLVVIADDIYTEFTYGDHKHIAIATLPGMKERTITVGSFSKNYCMTGWRIGYVIAPEPLISVMETVNQCAVFSAPTISQRAGLHAIKHKAEVLPGIVNTIGERMAYLQEALNSLKGVRCQAASSGMYLFPNIEGTGMTDKEFADYLFNEASIRVVEGSGFGEGGKGHVRIALTVPVPTLEKAIERMKQLPIFS